jgi:hypothetical protein
VRHDSFEFAALRRSKTATSMLMVCQTISNLLDKTTKTSCRGWFFKLYRRSVGGSSWAIAALAPRIGWGRFNRRVSD